MAKKREKMSFGEWMRARRKAAGMTQVQLSAATGIVQCRLSGYETGDVPLLTTACRIATALGADLGEYQRIQERVVAEESE